MELWVKGHIDGFKCLTLKYDKKDQTSHDVMISVKTNCGVEFNVLF